MAQKKKIGSPAQLEIRQCETSLSSERFRDMLDEIAKRHTATEPVNFDQVADMFTSIIEGGLVVGKATHDPRSLPEQILLYRHFVKMLFQPRPAAA